MLFRSLKHFNDVTERLDAHTGKFACEVKFTGMGVFF